MSESKYVPVHNIGHSAGEIVELDGDGNPKISSESWVVKACKADISSVLGVKDAMIAHILGKNGNNLCPNASEDTQKMSQACHTSLVPWCHHLEINSKMAKSDRQEIQVHNALQPWNTTVRLKTVWPDCQSLAITQEKLHDEVERKMEHCDFLYNLAGGYWGLEVVSSQIVVHPMMVSTCKGKRRQEWLNKHQKDWT
ncbi:hypothetical protein BDZ97DRAFT_1751501 [Flammula alnicola]|nr:hypothetical protein BDZ97DRAFT_1751501 [Flammula alnicola]